MVERGDVRRHKFRDQDKVSENNEIEYVSKIKKTEMNTKTLREEL